MDFHSNPAPLPRPQGLVFNLAQDQLGTERASAGEWALRHQRATVSKGPEIHPQDKKSRCLTLY